MTKILLAGVAGIGFCSLQGAAIAQTMPAPSAQPGDTTSPSPPQPDRNMTPPAPQPDPNAGQPTGDVPAQTGMVPAPADAPSDPAAPVGSSANPVTVGGNMTPAPTDRKDYPVCSRTMQDSCVNAGDVRKTRPRR